MGSHLQIIENDVPKCLVHPDEVERLLFKLKRAWAEGQGLEVMVLSQFKLVQTVVQRGQTMIGNSLIQLLTCEHKPANTRTGVVQFHNTTWQMSRALPVPTIRLPVRPVPGLPPSGGNRTLTKLQEVTEPSQNFRTTCPYRFID